MLAGLRLSNDVCARTVKTKLLFWETIWLLQFHDYPSYASSKNV